jgi:aryl-alcohol dehydrogenase-like predicted oxidoreductase
MERRAFGRTGMQVGVLGFGAAEIGFESTTDHTVERLLAEAVDSGVNVIDTAAWRGRAIKRLSFLDPRTGRSANK